MKNDFIQQVILESCRQTRENLIIQFGNLSTLGYKIWSLRKSEYLRSVNYKALQKEKKRKKEQDKKKKTENKKKKKKKENKKKEKK